MILKRIADLVTRIVLGLVFIFSGFVKAVDPMGSSYKFEEYFNAFGFHSLGILALPLAFLLSAMEFAIGMALMLNFLKRFTSWLLISFMLYFTGLTLIIAYINPVADCGCFGDAIKISNWATFYKNIILLLLAGSILWNNNKFYNRMYSLKTQRVLWLFFFLFPVGVSFYSILFLPVLDFRPYKLGTNIYESMRIPEDALKDEYVTTLFYEKDGVIKEFSEDNYPWQDTTWHIVEVKNELIKKGYIPEISGFNILNENGDEIGLDLLSRRNYQFLIFSTDLSKIGHKEITKINELYAFGLEKGYETCVINSSSLKDNQLLKYRMQSQIPLYQADEVLIKTVLRSNPGLIVLKEGTIVGKFNFNRVKIDQKFNGVLEHTLSFQRVLNNRYNILTLALIFSIILLIYLNLERKY